MVVKSQVNTTLLHSFMAASGPPRVLARGLSGRLWCCYMDALGQPNNSVYAAYSDDGGVTWIEEVAVNLANAYQYSLQMVVDSSGVPHLFYSSGGAFGFATRFLMHAHRAGGIWATELLYDAGAGNNITTSGACIGADDLIHLSWTGVAPSRYMSGTTAAWSASEAAVAGGRFLEVDSSGIPFLLLTPGGGSVEIARRVAGVWQAPEVVTAAGWAPQFSFDGSDNLHVIWLETVGGWDIVRYRKRSAAGVWGAVLDAVNEWTGIVQCLWPSLGVDSEGNAYIIVQRDDHLGDESVYFKQVSAAEALGALTVLDAAIIMPNTQPSVYSSLWHGGSQYSLVPATFQPVTLLLSENGVDADGFFGIYGMDGGGGGGGPLLVAPTVATLPATGVT